MKKRMLLLFSLVSIISVAQSVPHTISLSYKAGFTADHYTFNNEIDYSRWASRTSPSPVQSFSFDYSYRFSKFFTVNTGVSYEEIFIDYSGDDFLTDFGWKYDYRPLNGHEAFWAPRIGFGFIKDFSNRLVLISSASFIIKLPVETYTNVEDLDGRVSSLNKYLGRGKYKPGIMYGTGIDVGVLWKPFKDGGLKNFGVIAKLDAELLYFMESEFNPKWNIGPEIGLAFSF